MGALNSGLRFAGPPRQFGLRVAESVLTCMPKSREARRGPGCALRAAGARAWAVLAILCFVYVLNFLDRQLLSILAKPIQDELGVTDGQLGLISGLYFALFYCMLAIPVGWLADRSNRVRVLSFACALWSAATVACGLSSNYAQLAAARMSVGVGEAGGVPPSYAIISDYFPSGHARHGAGPVQSRAAASGRRWASRSARRSRPPIAGARHSSGWARSASSLR